MYGYKKETTMNFLSTISKVKDELQKEGFGVLTEIDVKETLKKKLNIDYKNYIILGACNPQFAHKALETETDIGLLLPCNIIIYENKNKVSVSAILPTIAMSIINNSKLKKIAKEVENKLKKVIDNVQNK